MNKKDRQRAMQAEIERRATKSGVLHELRVYEMEMHHSDEGGPRTFVPLKEVRSLNSKDYDRTLWPRLFRLAVQDGIPIELALDDSRIYRDGRTPSADISDWGDGEDHLLILTERANAALEPFLRKTCRVVPVKCATARLFGYHLVAVEDVLDVGNCEANWTVREAGKSCTHFTKYSIHTAKLGRSPIFRAPQNKYRILLLQPVVDVIEQHQLTGFRCKRVWPHSSIPPVVTIDVKRLPRAANDTRREPRLSTAAKEIEASFLSGLLGSPLIEDSNAPFELVAYRLPDLSMPSGSMVAADLLFSEGKPFARRVNPGDYPLTLVAACLDGNDERIAFALIQFYDRPVATWEIAIIGGAGGRKPRKSDQHGYGVDSGTGGFCDPEAQETLLKLADPEGTCIKRIEKEMAKTYRHTRSWVHVQTDAGSAAIFSSGYGDGKYQSYFGLDGAGEPVVLMTDFNVLDWPRRPRPT